MIPELMSLVKRPYLLAVTLGALHKVVGSRQDLVNIRVVRADLYDKFFEQWFALSLKRLESRILSSAEREALSDLTKDGFVAQGIDYLKRLADSVFTKQCGKAVIRYTPTLDKDTWKAEFFDSDPKIRLLREASPLTSTADTLRFSHCSILEYFYSYAVYSPAKHDLQDEASPKDVRPLDPECTLFTRSLLVEPSVVSFLSERVQESPSFKDQLLEVIEQSKTDASFATATSNAITILVRAGVRFNGADLRGIHIPGADISGGQFDSAQFQGADLTDVNLARSWLREADFSRVRMDGVRFGELPYLIEEDAIRSCRYSPNGMLFAVCYDRFWITLYYTSTWEKVRTLGGHRGKVNDLVFSSDSLRLVSAGDDGTVRVWDCESGEVLLVLEGHIGKVNSVAVSPCGKCLASASNDKTVRVWNLETGVMLFILEGHGEAVGYVEFTADGQQLVSGSEDGSIWFWDVQTGEQGALWASGHGRVKCLAVSPDGLRIATGHRGGVLQIRDIISGSPILVLQAHNDDILGIAFAPNAQWVATSSTDATVKVWDTTNGALVSILSGHSLDVNVVSFSPDGMQVASGSRDSTVRLWDWTSICSFVGQQGHSGRVVAVAYSPNGETVVSASGDGSVRRWNSLCGIKDGRVLELPSGNVKVMALSQDGTQAATTNGEPTICLSDLQIGVPGSILEGHSDEVVALAYSPCGRWIASSGRDNSIRLWDLHSVEQGHVLVKMDASSRPISHVAFSTTSHQLAISDMNGAVRVYDTHTRTLLKTITLEGVEASTLIYSPTNQQLAIGVANRNSIQLWDMETNESVAQLGLDDAVSEGVECMAFSPCGNWIASAYAGDKTVRLWHYRRRLQSGNTANKEDVGSWRSVPMTNAFFDTVTSIAWNPIRPLEFVTDSRDRSVRVWRIMDQGDGKEFTVCMLWGTNLGRLHVSGVMVGDAFGLSTVIWA